MSLRRMRRARAWAVRPCHFVGLEPGCSVASAAWPREPAGAGGA